MAFDDQTEAVEFANGKLNIDVSLAKLKQDLAAAEKATEKSVHSMEKRAKAFGQSFADMRATVSRMIVLGPALQAAWGGFFAGLEKLAGFDGKSFGEQLAEGLVEALSKVDLGQLRDAETAQKLEADIGKKAALSERELQAQITGLAQGAEAELRYRLQLENLNKVQIESRLELIRRRDALLAWKKTLEETTRIEQEAARKEDAAREERARNQAKDDAATLTGKLRTGLLGLKVGLAKGPDELRPVEAGVDRLRDMLKLAQAFEGALPNLAQAMAKGAGAKPEPVPVRMEFQGLTDLARSIQTSLGQPRELQQVEDKPAIKVAEEIRDAIKALPKKIGLGAIFG